MAKDSWNPFSRKNRKEKKGASAESSRSQTPPVPPGQLGRTTQQQPSIESQLPQNITQSSSAVQEVTAANTTETSDLIPETSHNTQHTQLSEELPLRPSTLTGGPTEAGATVSALSKSQILWSEAYDRLKADGASKDVVASYETILLSVAKQQSPEFDRHSVDLEDPLGRQKFSKLLLQHGKDRISKVSNATQKIGEVTKFLQGITKTIDGAIQSIPQAAIPWVGVKMALEIFSNPSGVLSSNADGIVYVTSKMEWYCALVDVVLQVKSENLKQNLEVLVIALYKTILLYQIKTVCNYYRHRGWIVLRTLVKMDDLESALNAVKSSEEDLKTSLGQFNDQTSLKYLDEFAQRTTALRDSVGDLTQVVSSYFEAQKVKATGDEDKEIMKALFVIDPENIMEWLESKKDKLLDAAFQWVLEDPGFVGFTDWENDDNRLLWINGPAGTGKTMLIIGIIRHFCKQSAVFAPSLAYFFCTGLDQTTANATNALRSLIWMLFIQQPQLIKHIRAKYEFQSASIFTSPSAFASLSSLLMAILADPDLRPAYFVIDALDECTSGLKDLIKLMFEFMRKSNKIRWLISSRPDVPIRKSDRGRLVVELDAQKLQEPVSTFIDYKLDELRYTESVPGYDDDSVVAAIGCEIRKKAENTFLWVALVFKELEEVEGWDALDHLQNIPSGLSKIYELIISKIESHSEINAQRCKNVLVAVFLAYRPVSLVEVGVLAGLGGRVQPNQIVTYCGSFLQVDENSVSFIHQSAQDYLRDVFSLKLLEGGLPAGHFQLAMASVSLLNDKLQKNFYNVEDYGVLAKDLKSATCEKLSALDYYCTFWVTHLSDSYRKNWEPTEPQQKQLLAFLSEHSLHWIEACVLGSRILDIRRQVKSLITHTQRWSISELNSFINDLDQFIIHFGALASERPLQIYASGLAFSPTGSLVKRGMWAQRAPFIDRVCGLPQAWEGKNNICEIPTTGDCMYLVVSPDREWVAAEFEDGDIWLYHPETRDCTRVFWGRHSLVLAADSDSQIDFSADSMIFAALSTNKVQWITLRTHSYGAIAIDESHSFNCLRFKSSTHCLLLISDDGFKWHLEIDNGESPSFKTDDARSVSGEPVCLSPDTCHLITILPESCPPPEGSDNPFQLWNMETFISTALVNAPFSGFCCRFSPDSSMFSLYDFTAREFHIYASSTGSYLYYLDSRETAAMGTSMSFSLDSSVFAFSNIDAIMQYRLDGLDGEQLYDYTEIKGNRDYTISFFDDKHIIGMSKDLILSKYHTGSVSDAEGGKVTEFYFNVSIDSRYVLSGPAYPAYQPSRLQCIRIRDIMSAASLCNLEVSCDVGGYSYAFPNPLQCAGGIAIFSTFGTPMRINDREWHYPDFVEIFSESGADRFCQFVDIRTGRPVAGFRHKGTMDACAISTDGKFVAVVLRDRFTSEAAVSLFSTTRQHWSYTLLEQLSEEDPANCAIKFSDDCALLIGFVSVWDRVVVYLWDTNSGTLLQRVEFSDLFFTKEIFISPCNNIIAVAGLLTCILTRAGAGEVFELQLYGPSSWGFRGFSKDSRYLVYEDGAVEVASCALVVDKKQVTGIHGMVFCRDDCIIGEGVYLWVPASYRKMKIAGDTVVLNRSDSQDLVFLYLNLPANKA